MILCSSFRNSSKSSPSNGSHTKTISMLSVAVCNSSLTLSETVTGIFKACKKRIKRKGMSITVNSGLSIRFRSQEFSPPIAILTHSYSARQTKHCY